MKIIGDDDLIDAKCLLLRNLLPYYFIGSCLDESECEKLEEEILSFYFKQLKTAFSHLKHQIDFSNLEKEWRELYPYAWADFHRFLKGWSPGHWKINSYSEKIVKKVIKDLGSL